jgi:hypothetical protein
MADMGSKKHLRTMTCISCRFHHLLGSRPSVVKKFHLKLAMAVVPQTSSVSVSARTVSEEYADFIHLHIDHAQILVIGGWFPLYDKCDAPQGQGQHNMVPGYNGGDAKLWDKFNPQLDDYVVPSPIINAIGGGWVFITRM